MFSVSFSLLYRIAFAVQLLPAVFLYAFEPYGAWHSNRAFYMLISLASIWVIGSATTILLLAKFDRGSETFFGKSKKYMALIPERTFRARIAELKRVKR